MHTTHTFARFVVVVGIVDGSQYYIARAHKDKYHALGSLQFLHTMLWDVIENAAYFFLCC